MPSNRAFFGERPLIDSATSLCAQAELVAAIGRMRNRGIWH